MTSISRRDFARFVALSGTATLLPSRAFADQETLESLGYSARPLPPTPAEPDEKFWRDVRARFLVPRDLAFLPGFERGQALLLRRQFRVELAEFDEVGVDGGNLAGARTAEVLVINEHAAGLAGIALVEQ